MTADQVEAATAVIVGCAVIVALCLAVAAGLHVWDLVRGGDRR